MKSELARSTALDHLLLGLKKGGAGDPDAALPSLLADEVLVKTGEKFGRRFVEMSTPAVFTEIERVAISIPTDPRTGPDRILLLAGENNPRRWTHKGVWKPAVVPEAVMVPGTFNVAMSMDGALNWALNDTEHKLRGSGAWARHAWSQMCATYQGERERHFPAFDSRWTDRYGQRGECGPSMWHDGGRMGKFGMNWYGDMMPAGHIFHFLAR